MVALKALAGLLARTVIFAAALALIVTGALKFQDPGAFHEALKAHGVIPGFALDIAPYLVIAIELLVGAGALWSAMHKRWPAAALSASAVFACIAVYAFALVIRPPAVPSGCGCGFSAGLIKDWAPIALRNALFCAALCVAAPLASTCAPQKGKTPEDFPRASRVKG